MFTAALGSPQSPSDPRCGYHAFLVQTVEVNDALPCPPCRAGCSLPCTGSSLCSGGLLLSPAGHPQHGLQCCPGFGDCRGHNFLLEQRKRRHTSDFLFSSAGYVTLGSPLLCFFPGSGAEGGLPSSPQDAVSTFRLVWKAVDLWGYKAERNSC